MLNPRMAAFASELRDIADAEPGMGIMKLAISNMVMAGMGLHPAGRAGAWGKINMGLTGLFTASQLPGLLRKEDPTGQGRSRLERAGQFVGGTIGSALPTGYMALRHPEFAGSWKGIATGIGAGIAGGALGSAVGSIPGRLLRRPAPQPVPEQPTAPQPGVPA